MSHERGAHERREMDNRSFCGLNCVSPNLYVKTLTPNFVTVFGHRAKGANKG